MIKAKLREFECDVIARGQISYGDVRRLQRDYLPSGITNPTELELLISLNAKVVRADKAWTQWLVASVAEFVSKQEVHEHQIKEAARECVGRLLGASTTSLRHRIVRQVRREVERPQGIQSTNSPQPPQKGRRSQGIQQRSQARARENDLRDSSLQTAKARCCNSDERPARSRPRRRTVRHKTNPGAALTSAAHDWCLPGYLPVIQRSHLINLEGSRASLLLAPCL
jgi:hypothetical protein